jgi:putative effector of murein hydrolase LrgA (UPF0299 family)
MKDKTRAFGIVALFALVSLTLLLLSGIVSGKGMLYESASWLVLGVVVLTFGVIYFRGGLKDVKNGLPFQDERTKKISLQAGSKTFELSIWWMLALMYISDKIDILPRHVAAAGIVGMALLFFLSWTWYDTRGAPE